MHTIFQSFQIDAWQMRAGLLFFIICLLYLWRDRLSYFAWALHDIIGEEVKLVVGHPYLSNLVTGLALHAIGWVELRLREGNVATISLIRWDAWWTRLGRILEAPAAIKGLGFYYGFEIALVVFLVRCVVESEIDRAVSTIRRWSLVLLFVWCLVEDIALQMLAFVHFSILLFLALLVAVVRVFEFKF